MGDSYGKTTPPSQWRKSSHSISNCVEVSWRKSSYCQAQECVEVAEDNGFFLVRDSKEGEQGPVLQFTTAEWKAFLLGVADGEFNPEVFDM